MNVLNIPQSAPIDIKTGNWAEEWRQWIINPKFLTIETGEALGPASGGTGLASTPPVDTLLVGNGTNYSLSTTLPVSALFAFTGDVTKPDGGAALTLADVNSAPGSYGSGTQVSTFTVNAKGLITASSNTPVTGAPGPFVVTNGFGCNGRPAQIAAVIGSAVSGTAGATYTATEQTLLNDTKTLLNQIRSALVNNGIAV